MAASLKKATLTNLPTIPPHASVRCARSSQHSFCAACQSAVYCPQLLAMQRTLKIGIWIGLLVVMFGVQHLLDPTAEAQRALRYEVDPFWPKLPAKFALGQ